MCLRPGADVPKEQTAKHKCAYTPPRQAHMYLTFPNEGQAVRAGFRSRRMCRDARPAPGAANAHNHDHTWRMKARALAHPRTLPPVLSAEDIAGPQLSTAPPIEGPGSAQRILSTAAGRQV